MLGDVYFYGGLTLVAHPAALFSPSFSQDEGENKMEELMGEDKNREITHQLLSHKNQI